MTRSHPRLRLAAAAVLLAAAPAAGLTDLESLAASPDVTGVFGGAEVRDHDVLVDDLAGTTALAGLGALPEAAAVDAFHDPGQGDLLFSFESRTDVGGLAFADGDLVRYDGGAYTAAFDAAAAGLPAGVGVDAVTSADGDLLISFDSWADLPGGPFRPSDLVRWDGGGFSLVFDGAAAGVPPGLDLDAAHRLQDGHLLLSFDAGGELGGLVFADEDVLEHDPGSGGWELAFDASEHHPAWGPADLDALSVGEPPSVLEIPTLGPAALAALALLLAASGLIGLRRPRTAIPAHILDHPGETR